MMALSGVRSSWLMLARNWVLARLAASADSLAWRSARSCRRRSVASVIIMMVSAPSPPSASA